MTGNAAEALKAEATNTNVKVEFRGETYEIPGNAEEYDLEVMEAYEDGKLVSALRALLGEAQWSLLKTRTRPKLKDLNEIAATFLGTVGLSSEKSEG